jgi:hypothetical protein
MEEVDWRIGIDGTIPVVVEDDSLAWMMTISP